MNYFTNKVSKLDRRSIEARMQAVTSRQVRGVLQSNRVSISAAPILFSPAAGQFLEPMAQMARRQTLKRFGRTITLYTPIYLSNHCVNQCAYCGFASGRAIRRKLLSVEEIESEAESLFQQGIRHILLVTGEAPHRYGLDRICEAAGILRKKAASISVEIFPSELDGYRSLISSGVDGLVLYQETYLQDVYASQHLSGPKRNFERRLMAMEAAGEAGFRSLGIGSLLGLSPPRLEACYLAYHAHHLTQTYPQARIAISFPRLRPVEGGTPILHAVTDRDLAQLVIGMRLMFPDAELILSTRESAGLRDSLFQLGITRMSAGSKTVPGGYTDRSADQKAGQFQVDDDRCIQQIMQAIQNKGYDVVCKDFDTAFVGDGLPS